MNSENQLNHEPVQQNDSITNTFFVDFDSIFRSKDALKSKAFKGELRNSNFRSLIWRIYLECLPENKDELVIKIKETRNFYDEINKKYHIDLNELVKRNCQEDNPLSQHQDSNWNRYFNDCELKSRIKQDVKRTFPEIDFFQLKKIQRIMVNILFNFAKENPEIDYKQGMHELLAPILFVLHCDHQSFLHAQEIGLLKNDSESCNLISELMDPNYIEHDSYCMFNSVMFVVESWFNNDVIYCKVVNPEPFLQLNQSPTSILGVKLKMISEQILKRFDDDLYNHLFELKIEPQIYGIRWLRLLFGREFAFEDLLVVWDSIFADGISFGFCDYLFVSMLMTIRGLLLKSDFNNSLNLLMRFPQVNDIQYVIDLALFLRDPINYPKPVVSTLNVIPVTELTMKLNERKERIRRPTKLAIKKDYDLQLKTNEGSSSDFKQKIHLCCDKMEYHIDCLENYLNKQTKKLDFEDKIMVSLAEMKKIKDILRGNLNS